MHHLAICGVGNIGRVHIRNLQSLRGVKIGGVFDADASAAREVARHFALRAYGTLRELLSDPEVTAVVVATPAGSHREICQMALAAGKHVFVEKPLADTLDDAQAIVDTPTGDRIVQVGFCERFNPNYLEARRAAASGALGQIRVIQSSRMAPYALCDPAWPLGVLDTAAHNIDLVLWLMGQLPVTVLARAARIYPDGSIPHMATIVMTFANGAMAVDQIAWVRDEGHPLHSCARSRMSIYGERGSFEVDLADRPSSLLDKEGWRKIDTIIVGAPEYAGCLKLQFEHFLRSCEEGSPPLATALDAFNAERVIIAARDSIATGKEVHLNAHD